MAKSKRTRSYRPNKSQPETFTKKTMCNPTQALTVRQMLLKHAQGTLYDNAKTPIYEDQAIFSTTPLNVIQNMDLADKMAFLKDHKVQTQNLLSKVEKLREEQLEQIAANEISNAAKKTPEKPTE